MDQPLVILGASTRAAAFSALPAGLACPGISFAASPPPGRWLIKPRQGAGGKGIRHHRASAAPRRDRRFYYQEYIEGENCAAIYVGHPSETRLLGVTRQLVGESW